MMPFSTFTTPTLSSFGKTVEFEENGQLISGTATDLTETGELIVNTGGLIKVLSSGEISLKKWL